MTPTATADAPRPSISNQPLSADELRKMNAYWRAANYLSVGQIYLLANPLLREPLKLEHVKPRLLGHWGTTPGLNFIYVHFNRLIKKYDLNAIYICGPGHGGPGMVANTYLEGTYTEFYSGIQQNEDGMRQLFKQFSFPAAFPVMMRPRPRFDSRGWRTWLLASACLWRGLRQSRSAGLLCGGRWRSGNRTARD